MRILFLTLILVAAGNLFSQDTAVTWMFNIDSAAFVTYYARKEIPVEIYSIIGIRSTSDIANPDQTYQEGCVGNGQLPMKKLNWIAKDTNNHLVLSISYGGRASGTRFYFIDKEKGVLNTNILYFNYAAPEFLTLNQIIARVSARRFTRG